MEREKRDVAESADVQAPPKKPYHPPQVIIHGTVEDITQAIGGAPTDGLGGSIL